MKKRKRWHEVLDRLPEGSTAMTEIGVWRGALAQQVLERRPGLRMTLVDLWLAGADNPSWHASGSQMAQRSQAEVDDIFDRVMTLLGAYRLRVLRMASVAAAPCVPDGSQDLVFIDADHSEAAVAADISAWQGKVRPGGWLGGHDYGSPRFPGVRAAVDAAFLHVETGADRTWFVRL